MPKARCSSYIMIFKIKVIAEAKAVENSSEIARDFGLFVSLCIYALHCWLIKFRYFIKESHREYNVTFIKVSRTLKKTYLPPQNFKRNGHARIEADIWKLSSQRRLCITKIVRASTSPSIKCKYEIDFPIEKNPAVPGRTHLCIIGRRVAAFCLRMTLKYPRAGVNCMNRIPNT